MSAPEDGRRLTPSYRPVQREKRPPCQEGCPNAGDIRGWIGVIAQHEQMGISRREAFARAWATIADVNPFPAVLGRVCPHPCESGCNRDGLDGSVSINALERFLGDWALQEELPLPRLHDARRPERIGVVGSGPSGLSFAYQMARRGYRVVVYEGRDRPGGMLRYGIPDYRLPQHVLDAEIRRILALGVELKLGCLVGRDVTFRKLKETYDALYVAIGAQRGRSLGISGEEGPGVWSGTEYLARVNRGEPVELGSDVVVVGGGNTAIDAARTARRSSPRVTVLYRRSRTEMPAFGPEVDEAEEEGVRLSFLAAPVRIEHRNGSVRSVVAMRMQLGKPDASGRRRPLPVPGSEFEIAASAVISAISQEPVWTGLEEISGGGGAGWIRTDANGVVARPERGPPDDRDGTPTGPSTHDADTGDPDAETVWAGGDVRGLGIAGDAIVHGRRAAEAVHRRLGGLPPPAPDERPPIGPDRVLYEVHPPAPPAVPERLPPEERLANPRAEVTLALSEDEVVAEAGRCLSCGSCYGCRQCWMFCTPGCFTRVDEPEPGVYFTLSLDQCEECGKCVEVCPCGFLELGSSREDPPSAGGV